MENFNPTFWNDSPTAVEQIRFLIKQNLENENKIKSVEDTLQDILKWIESTDSKIKEEVTKVVWQMYENGELAQIIKDTVNDYLKNVSLNAMKTQSIDLRREMRGYARCYKPYTADFAGDYYSFNFPTLSGACDFERNGQNYSAFLFISDVGKWKVSNYVELRIYSHSANGDDYNLEFKGYAKFGHANDCCYSHELDKLLIAESSKYLDGAGENDGRVASGVVYGVDLSKGVNGIETIDFTQDDITYKNIINLTRYDFSNSIPSTNGISEFENKIYIANSYDIYVVDDFAKLKTTKLYSLNKKIGVDSSANGKMLIEPQDWFEITGQTFAINSKYLYFLKFNPNCIVRYDRALNKFDTVFNMPKCFDAGTYLIGEPEAIDVDELGNISVFCYSEMAPRSVCGFKIFQKFVGNIENPAFVLNAHYYSGSQTYGKPYDRTLVVYDKGWNEERAYIPNKDKYTMNPAGNDSGGAFSTLAEACWLINNAEWAKGKYFTIRIINDGDKTPPCWITTNASGVEIVSRKKENGEFNIFHIGNIFAKGSVSITTHYVKIRNRVCKNAPHSDSAFGNCAVFVKGGVRLTMLNGTKIDLPASAVSPINDGIHCEESTFTCTTQAATTDLPRPEKFEERSATSQMITTSASICLTHGWITKENSRSYTAASILN